MLSSLIKESHNYNPFLFKIFLNPDSLAIQSISFYNIQEFVSWVKAENEEEGWETNSAACY